MYTEDLENLILNRHRKNNSDELLILGGFIGISPIEKIATEIKSTIIYGCMKKSNLNLQQHNKYLSITNASNAEVLYKKNYNHSKIYCWLHSNQVVEIIAGSANFSTSGLNNDYQESLFDVPEKDYEKTYDYLQQSLNDCIPCAEHQFIPQKKGLELNSKVNNLDKILSKTPPSARLSLRSSKGTFHDSGINVGQKNLSGAHVNINDCYVPIRVEIIDSLPELFPNNGIHTKVGAGYGKAAKKKKPNAEFLFDDGEVIDISFEQIGPKRSNGYVYKAFRSFRPNSKLGEYLRRRLGLESGVPFEEKDFIRYGRDHIDLTLLDEGIYYADFSGN